jgi:hypothetical protein
MAGSSVIAIREPFDTIETILGDLRHASAASASHKAARDLEYLLAREPPHAGRQKGRTSMSRFSLQPMSPYHAGARQREVQVPTDLLAALLMEQVNPAPTQEGGADGVPIKIYVIMLVTTLLTFATLLAGYRFFFSHQLFG